MDACVVDTERGTLQDEAPWETRKVCSRRSVRYARRTVAARRLRGFGVCTCGKPLGLGDMLVSVGSGDDGKRWAAFEGHETCGSAWVCPVCSSKIRAQRGAEVHEGMSRWFEADGHAALLVTLTERHHRGDNLSTLLQGMASAWRRVVGNRRYRRWKKSNGVVGYIRALEITYGRNGFHPHHHMLILVDGVVNEAVAEGLRRLLLELWTEALVREGLDVPNGHGVDVKPVGSQWQSVAADYVTKIVEGFSAEVTGFENKDGRGDSRVPFELLDDESPESIGAWQEYAKATKGRRCIWWSRGLRALLGMDVEQTDDEIMDEEGRSGVHREALIDRAAYCKALRESASTLADALKAIERREYRDAAAMLGCGVAVESHRVTRFLVDSEGEDHGLETDCVMVAAMRPEYLGRDVTDEELSAVGWSMRFVFDFSGDASAVSAYS